MITRAFEIRLYPNHEQEVQLNRTFGACRFLYNCTLYAQQEFYKEHKSSSIQLICAIDIKNFCIILRRCYICHKI